MTPEQIIEKQKQGLGILWRAFNYNKSDIGRRLGYSRSVVGSWFSRGRISATAAIKAEQTEEAKSLGLTKEMLRPDVNEWYGL